MGCSSDKTKFQDSNKKNNAANEINDKSDKKINSIFCPSCNEPFGKNFITSGFGGKEFRCFRCSKERYSNYYMCKICNGIFCTICPQNRYKHYAKCPLCKEKPGNKFIASGLEKKNFTCFRCGSDHYIAEPYYNCKNCNAIFCIDCPYRRNK